MKFITNKLNCFCKKIIFKKYFLEKGYHSEHYNVYSSQRTKK